MQTSHAETDRKPLRVLLLQAEPRRWTKARSYSYSLNFGLEEALLANGVEVLMVTTPWISQIRKICGQRQFDQVWLNDLSHIADFNTPLDDIVDLAPIRIGFVTESLEYHPEEYAEFEWLHYRRERIDRPFAYATHFAAVDEKDVLALRERYQKPTMWLPCSSPSFMVADHVPQPTQHIALFSGSPYGQRVQWLETPLLKNLLTYQRPSNSAWLEALLFDLLPGHGINRVIRGQHVPARLLYPIYLGALRRLRRRSARLWQKGMQPWAAIVNLPHLVKGYSSRVIEGMASGRPVISWKIPDRPLNQALFEHGQEILLYETPAELASCIEQVQADVDFAQAIAENALGKLKQFHTTEHRVQQILHWIESGEQPTYGIATNNSKPVL